MGAILCQAEQNQFGYLMPTTETEQISKEESIEELIFYLERCMVITSLPTEERFEELRRWASQYDLAISRLAYFDLPIADERKPLEECFEERARERRFRSLARGIAAAFRAMKISQWVEQNFDSSNEQGKKDLESDIRLLCEIGIENTNMRELHAFLLDLVKCEAKNPPATAIQDLE